MVTRILVKQHPQNAKLVWEIFFPRCGKYQLFYFLVFIFYQTCYYDRWIFYQKCLYDVTAMTSFVFEFLSQMSKNMFLILYSILRHRWQNVRSNFYIWFCRLCFIWLKIINQNSFYILFSNIYFKESF